MKMKRTLLLLCLGMLLVGVARADEYDEEYGDEGDHYDEGAEEHYDEEELEEHAPLPTFGHESDVPNMLSFETLSEQEFMHNFKKISNDVYQYEEEYSNCIKDISDHEYTEQRIEECIGRNFIKVVLDIKYETLKIISRADTKVRKLFIEACYIPAGTVEEFSIGCDLMERDGLDLMWKGLDFVQLLQTNKEKYIREYAKIPYDEFRDIIDHLSDFAKKFFQLLDEVDSHKEVTILRLKTLIDDRTKLIVEEAKSNPDIVLPPEIKHKIEITEELVDPNAISIENLPPPQILNSNPKDFGLTVQDDARKKARALSQPIVATRRVPAVSTQLHLAQRPVGHFQTRPQAQTVIRRAPITPAARKALYATNHYRMFNQAHPYSGLHAQTQQAKTVRTSPASLQSRLGLRGLRPSEKFASVKFKSVHTSGAPKGWLSKRFK